MGGWLFWNAGSYSHQALERYFAGQHINRHHYALFEDVVQAVKNGEIKYGVLPIENSRPEVLPKFMICCGITIVLLLVSSA